MKKDSFIKRMNKEYLKFVDKNQWYLYPNRLKLSQIIYQEEPPAQ